MLDDFNIDDLDKILEEPQKKEEETSDWYSDFIAEDKKDDFIQELNKKIGTTSLDEIVEGKNQVEMQLAKLQEEYEQVKSNPMYSNPILNKIGGLIQGKEGSAALDAIKTFYEVNAISDLSGEKLAKNYLKFKHGLDDEKAAAYLNSTIYKGLGEEDGVAKEIALKTFNETAKTELDSIKVKFEDIKVEDKANSFSKIKETSSQIATRLIDKIDKVDFNGVEVELGDKSTITSALSEYLAEELKKGSIKSAKDLANYKNIVKRLVIARDYERILPILMQDSSAKKQEEDLNRRRSGKSASPKQSIIDAFK